MDTIHHYAGYHGCASRCRIRVYQEPEQPPACIATELHDNEGTSVTNAAERLATELLRDGASGEPIEAVWIEHYPAEHVAGRCTFALVTFKRNQRGEYASPSWQAMTRAEVERMVGEGV